MNGRRRPCRFLERRSDQVFVAGEYFRVLILECLCKNMPFGFFCLAQTTPHQGSDVRDLSACVALVLDLVELRVFGTEKHPAIARPLHLAARTLVLRRTYGTTLGNGEPQSNVSRYDFLNGRRGRYGEWKGHRASLVRWVKRS